MTVIIENVSSELDRLEQNTSSTIEAINQSFEAMLSLIAKRKEELLCNIETIRSQKRQIFNEQLQLIEAEKGRVERDCEGISPGFCD